MEVLRPEIKLKANKLVRFVIEKYIKRVMKHGNFMQVQTVTFVEISIHSNKLMRFFRSKK